MSNPIVPFVVALNVDIASAVEKITCKLIMSIGFLESANYKWSSAVNVIVNGID